MNANEYNSIKELIDKAQNILVVTHEHPTPDSIGSSLALMLGLASIGKKVTVGCPEAVTVSLSNFIGVNKIVTDIEKKNFVISLDYVDGSIEKVSYNIEGDKFNLVIEPRPGFDTFSAEKVHYSHAGANADLVIAVDTIHLGGLKRLYEADKELYASKPVIVIDRHPNNAMFGQVNLVDASASSTAELVARTLSFLSVRLTVDIATNLLNALFGATNNFQNQNVSAGAFELAAACLKAGGKKFALSFTGQEEPVTLESVMPQVPAREAPQTQKPQVSTQEASVSPYKQSFPAHGGGFAEPSSQPTQGTPSAPKQAPADWLKPKIFKSSNIS